MGKKNLAILLVLPFAISLLGISVISTTFNLIDTDIIGIGWDYKDTIGIKVGLKEKLSAYGINNKNYPVTNAKLIWKVENTNANEETHAEIVDDNYLFGKSAGEIRIVCTNESGTIYKYINGVVYDDSAIIVNSEITGSQSNVDPTIYYGQYNLDENGKKIEASFKYTLNCFGGHSVDEIKVIETTDNIKVDEKNRTIKIISYGEAKIKFGFDLLGQDDTCVKSFQIVKDAVNVYSYDDLLYCTNKSEKGEIVCLRKSLESLDNTYNLNENGSIESEKHNNVALFGHCVYNNDKEKKVVGFTFKDEIYQFETLYNNEYIKEWNNFAKDNKKYTPISDLINVGIRVQKSFYGNGYTINLHNLTYPYESKAVNGVIVPTLTEDNLFRGPLPFYLLGNPNGTPLVGAYGQDNIGMYVDGDNITISDLNLKNCDFGNNLANLDYVGTVLETNGDNITIQDSRLSNGKNVLKCMSSYNTKLVNSLLSYSRNFLISIGSNEFEKVNDQTEYWLNDDKNNSTKTTIKEFLKEGASGDETFNNYLNGIYNQSLKDSIENTQMHLDYYSDKPLEYKGTLDIIDSLFYMSGISSIGLESMFNGPFLYNASPSIISKTFSEVFSQVGGSYASLIPFFPTNIGGTSYPVKVSISKSTRFYDYKKVDNIDLSGLILENISEFINNLNLGGSQIREITIDDIFPLITILRKKVEDNGSLYRINENGKQTSYVNIISAFYGGGKNSSQLIFNDDATYKNEIRSPIPLSFLEEYLQDKYSSNNQSGDIKSNMKKMLLKCVTVVTGFNPFSFVCSRNNGYLFNETPKVQMLINNKKG